MHDPLLVNKIISSLGIRLIGIDFNEAYVDLTSTALQELNDEVKTLIMNILQIKPNNHIRSIRLLNPRKGSVLVDAIVQHSSEASTKESFEQFVSALRETQTVETNIGNARGGPIKFDPSSIPINYVVNNNAADESVATYSVVALSAAVGCVVAVVVLLIVLMLCQRRRHRSKEHKVVGQHTAGEVDVNRATGEINMAVKCDQE